MAKVEFLGPIDKESLDVEISKLSELKEMFSQDETLKEWLSVCAVAVNDQMVDSLDVAINPNDKISLLPPVCGG